MYDVKIYTDWRRNQSCFHQYGDHNPKPYRIEAHVHHNWKDNRDSRQHHGQCFHKHTQQQIEHNDDQHRFHRREAKSLYSLQDRLCHTHKSKDKIKEHSCKNDQHNHRRCTHRAFKCITEHLEVKRTIDCCDNQSEHHPDGSRFGRGCHTHIDRTHYRTEQQNRRQ